MEGLTPALLSEVWWFTRATTLNTPDWQEGEGHCSTIADYFGRNVGRRHHRTFGLAFLVTEVLCLATLPILIAVLHLLLGDFLLYLPKYLEPGLPP